MSSTNEWCLLDSDYTGERYISHPYKYYYYYFTLKHRAYTYLTTYPLGLMGPGVQPISQGLAWDTGAVTAVYFPIDPQQSPKGTFSHA